MKKKLLAILTSVLLLCAMFPLGTVSVSAATSGTIGDCTWTLDDTHLTISGNGKMGDYTYSNKAPWGTAITSVTIEEGVTSISENAFSECESLVSVTIGNSVTTIGAGAFYDCASLTSVTIPDSVTTLGIDAFCECVSLGAIDVNENNPNYSSLEGVLFDKAQTTLIRYPAGKPGAYTIPDSVISIEFDAFDFCGSLTSVTIPTSVTTISNYAFHSCGSLTDVYYIGSEASKESISILRGNRDLLNATWHYNCINPKDHYSADVTHSVMDTENGNGLAFRFELNANNVAVKNRVEADLVNATINYLGKDCKLLGMGAVMANDATIGATAFTLDDVNGVKVIDIPAVYLCDLEPDSCAFAVRIINIPDTQLERTIYARPYYIVEVDGEEIVVYGDVDTASCAEYM